MSTLYDREGSRRTKHARSFLTHRGRLCRVANEPLCGALSQPGSTDSDERVTCGECRRLLDARGRA